MEVNSNKQLSLASYMLRWERFKGSHTGKNISESFENIYDKNDIRSKLYYNICDNAANMKKAFTVCLFKDDGGDVSADSYGQQMRWMVKSMMIHCGSHWSQQINSLFMQQHPGTFVINEFSVIATLQLVVGDGVK